VSSADAIHRHVVEVHALFLHDDDEQHHPEKGDRCDGLPGEDDQEYRRAGEGSEELRQHVGPQVGPAVLCVDLHPRRQKSVMHVVHAGEMTQELDPRSLPAVQHEVHDVEGQRRADEDNPGLEREGPDE
jgi:hypothetical protein